MRPHTRRGRSLLVLPEGLYSRARYYDPTRGRFLSEDPLRFYTSANFYIYASNDLTRFVDPLGLSDQDVQQITANYSKCVAQLEAAGERRPGSGTRRGRSR